MEGKNPFMEMASLWLAKTGKLKTQKFSVEALLRFQACESQSLENLTSCSNFLFLNFSIFQSEENTEECFVVVVAVFG